MLSHTFNHTKNKNKKPKPTQINKLVAIIKNEIERRVAGVRLPNSFMPKNSWKNCSRTLKRKCSKFHLKL
jgi:hypothetical protein